jgi:phosphate/sulfate permease
MSPDPLTLAAAEQARKVALQMLAERGRGEVLVGIASGWITTPLLAAVMGFVLLFVVQNVFGQQVYQAAVSRG